MEKIKPQPHFEGDGCMPPHRAEEYEPAWRAFVVQPLRELLAQLPEGHQERPGIIRAIEVLRYE
jgi:hypothetical protein